LEGLPSIAIAVASSGIAATLLLGGRTFHSRFKAPVNNLGPLSTCNISNESGLAQLLRMAKVIVWDEAPMAHRHLLEALDRTLRDIMDCDEPFGGKVIVLSGDFRQTLPIVKRGSRAQVVGASIKRSVLWEHFEIFEFTVNMRLRRDDARGQEYSDWLIRIGNGTMETVQDEIELDQRQCLDSGNVEALIEWIYPNLAVNSASHEWMSSRAILAPTNAHVGDLNDTVLDAFPGSHFICLSADGLTPGEVSSMNIQIEFLNTLQPAGMPPHCLKLKKGMPIMLLRNMDPKGGLCNGTRLIVDSVVNGRLLKAFNPQNNQIVLLPRVLMIPAEEGMPFTWRRRQFPVAAAFAMTINKSQGQTIQNVAVYLDDPVFSHGQLYVAASRVGNPDNLRFAIPSGIRTSNIVYREALR
jgi:hypothetical protein